MLLYIIANETTLDKDWILGIAPPRKRIDNIFLMVGQKPTRNLFYLIEGLFLECPALN